LHFVFDSSFSEVVQVYLDQQFVDVMPASHHNAHNGNL